MKLYSKILAFALCASMTGITTAQEVPQEKTSKEFKESLEKFHSDCKTAQSTPVTYEETQNRWVTKFSMLEEFGRVQKASENTHNAAVKAQNTKNGREIEAHETDLRALLTQKGDDIQTAKKNYTTLQRELQVKRNKINALIYALDARVDNYQEQVEQYQEEITKTLEDGKTASRERDLAIQAIEEQYKKDEAAKKAAEVERLKGHNRALEVLKTQKGIHGQRFEACHVIFAEIEQTLEEENRLGQSDYAHLAAEERQERRTQRLHAFDTGDVTDVPAPAHVEKHTAGWRYGVKRRYAFDQNDVIAHYKHVILVDEKGNITLQEAALEEMSHAEKQYLLYTFLDQIMPAYKSVKAKMNSAPATSAIKDDSEIVRFARAFQTCIINRGTGDADCLLHIQPEEYQKAAARFETARKIAEKQRRMKEREERLAQEAEAAKKRLEKEAALKKAAVKAKEEKTA